MGADVGLAGRSSRWSVGVAGLIDAPVAMAAKGGGSVSAWSVVGEIVPCAHLGALLACVVGQAGAEQASSQGVAVSRSTSLAWAGAGVRLGVEVPLEGQTLFRLHTSFVYDLAPPQLVLNDATAWRAPAVAASLGGDGGCALLK